MQPKVKPAKGCKTGGGFGGQQKPRVWPPATKPLEMSTLPLQNFAQCCVQVTYWGVVKFAGWGQNDLLPQNMVYNNSSKSVKLQLDVFNFPKLSYLPLTVSCVYCCWTRHSHIPDFITWPLACLAPGMPREWGYIPWCDRGAQHVALPARSLSSQRF